MSKWVVLAAISALAIGLLIGCGATGQTPTTDLAPAADQSTPQGDTQVGGDLVFHVNFPDRSSASARLIPVRTQSIEFYLVDDRNDIIFWDYATPDDPTVVISEMPAGLTAHLVAIAYPWSMDDGGDAGVASRELELPPLHDALAYATQPVTIPPAGEAVSVDLVLESTIVQLECDPPTVIMDVGDEIYPFVTAWNEWGDIVFIDPNTLEWTVVDETPNDSTTSSVIAVLDYGGLTARGYGMATLEVAETESGVALTVPAEVVVGGSGDAAGTSIAGQVADAMDPTIPIEGAQIIIVPDDGATAAQAGGEIFSDADGYFYVEGVPGGPSILRVVPPPGSPYAGWRHPIDVPGNAALWLDMLLVPQQVEDRIVDIMIEPEGAVVPPGDGLQYRARAVDAAGNDLHVAPMWVAKGQAGKIESDGWFQARQEAGVGEVLAVMGSHLARTNVTVAAEGPTGGPLGTVFGRTVDAVDPSLLIGGVTITAYPWSDAAGIREAGDRRSKPVGIRNFVSAVSAADGSFMLEGVPAGPTTLWVEPILEANVEPFGVDLNVVGNADVRVRIALATRDIMDQISWIEVRPNDWDGPVQAGPGEIINFDATVWDYNDEPLALTPTWTVIGPIGHIDDMGTFQARTDLGPDGALHGPISVQVGWWSVWTGVDVRDPGVM